MAQLRFKIILETPLKILLKAKWVYEYKIDICDSQRIQLFKI